MAETRRWTLAGSLRKWIPSHSILGRILFPLLEERRSLPAILTWMGIAIVLVFFLIAFLSPVLAPWDPQAFWDGPDFPPWSNAPGLSNSTYISFSTSMLLNITYGQALDVRSV